MPDSNPDMRTNADGSVTVIVQGAPTDIGSLMVFRDNIPTLPRYSFPPFHDIDERTMTAIYRVTDTHEGEEDKYDTHVKIAIIGCPMCGLRGGDVDCSRCHGRGRIPIIDRTMSSVEIVQRGQTLAQRKDA